jgi:hypothetical protein
MMEAGETALSLRTIKHQPLWGELTVKMQTLCILEGGLSCPHCKETHLQYSLLALEIHMHVSISVRV